ncbi:MAG TPA: KTSC domain-containing protein [Tepidiformaceae bacterium]|nr:KTSC domain-containing protein [Tepidiformaceae bacterium]
MERVPPMHPVESSTMDPVGYDPVTAQLCVRCLSSGEMYVYDAVPREVFEALLQAESKGRYFNCTSGTASRPGSSNG